MWVLRVTLYVLVLHHNSAETNHLINWQISNPPIVFGQDVVLFCNTSLAENCCTNTATWMKGFDVIVHHGSSTDYSKYIQEKQSNGFLLIIKNFDEDDINQQYTCLYDFSSYSAVLRIDRHNFKYIPNEDELQANINKTSDNILFADVIFFKVYPLPECILVANQEKLNTNVTVEEEAKQGLFYKIHLVCEIHSNTCMDNVAVLCTIGNDEMVVHNESFAICPDINDSLWFAQISLDKKILIIFIFSGLLMCATFITVCVLMWKKRPRSSRAICSCIEGSAANSTSSASCCVRFWEMRDNGYDDESELTPLLASNSDTTHNVQSNNSYLENQTNVPLTSRKCTTIPAQNYKDVTNIVHYGIGHDKSYIPTLISNLKIYIANLRKNALLLKAFRNVSKMPVKRDKCMTDQSYGPAQTENDVNNMITYAKISDKVFAEKLASDALINARRQKTIPSLKPCPSVPAPPCTNVSVSDIDVIKGSSMIPTWGARKRSRISITGKQGSSNE